MIGSSSLRRYLAAIVILLGLSSQFQMVFACELMDGKAHSACCCSDAGDMSIGCEQGGGCQESAAGSLVSASNCCQVSYEPVSSVYSIATEHHAQKVLLSNAPQPPPILAVVLQDVAALPLPSSIRFHYTTYFPFKARQIYLLTNRFRI
ncbi:MAG: hypothetical protein HUJ30_07570 [Gammaproteobacteria bacterium]|nr:hypothetical protein [Gammaproteobacteria bacterium]